MRGFILFVSLLAMTILAEFTAWEVLTGVHIDDIPARQVALAVLYTIAMLAVFLPRKQPAPRRPQGEDNDDW